MQFGTLQKLGVPKICQPIEIKTHMGIFNINNRIPRLLRIVCGGAYTHKRNDRQKITISEIVMFSLYLSKLKNSFQVNFSFFTIQAVILRFISFFFDVCKSES